MNFLKINDIDYRNILINNYKELNLTENELIVLLMIDSINKNEKTLISGDQLAFKMNLNSQQIDEIIVSLMNKSFLSYQQDGDILITSIENTYQRIISFVEKKYLEDSNDETIKNQEENLTRILKILEEEMKRSLSGLEMEKVINWFNEGVNVNVIENSINECIMKSNKVSINAIDKLIIKNLTHVDREEEGYSTVSEKTKKDIKKAMDIASYDWVNRHEE